MIYKSCDKWNVIINGNSAFILDNKEDAENFISDFLDKSKVNLSRKNYFVNLEGDYYNLYSVDKFSPVVYDRLEQSVQIVPV